jgi:hypothetical protein
MRPSGTGRAPRNLSSAPLPRLACACPSPRRRLYRSLIARMPIRTAAYVIATSLIDRDAGRAAAIE